MLCLTHLLLLLVTEYTTGMAHLTIINASWGPIHKHENLKRKLYNCSANIYFNQECLQKQLIPNYAISSCVWLIITCNWIQNGDGPCKDYKLQLDTAATELPGSSICEKREVQTQRNGCCWVLPVFWDVMLQHRESRSQLFQWFCCPHSQGFMVSLWTTENGGDVALRTSGSSSVVLCHIPDDWSPILQCCERLERWVDAWLHWCNFGKHIGPLEMNCAY